MPNNVPEDLKDKYDSCVQQVIESGESEEAAYPICYMSVVEGKSLAHAKAYYFESLKIGARNSGNDAKRLQDIHDLAVENGAKCHDTYPAMMSLEDGLVTFGTAVKALDNGRVGGYLVRFSTDKDPDLAGDFFTPDTDFGNHKTADVYYNHGLDATLKRRKIGKVDLTPDDVGIWAEAQLELRDEYEKAIYDMAKAGKLGWSSGTASHLMERKSVGSAQMITRWPLGLDASLTPTPAEPRNGAVSIKSLLPAEVTGVTLEDDPQAIKTTNEVNMELSEEKLASMLEAAATKAVQAAQPPIKSAGFATGAAEVVRDEADQPFKSFGHYMQAVARAANGSEDVRLKPMKASGLNEATPSQGGYLVYPQYVNQIVNKMYATSGILNAVRWFDLGPNSNRLIIPAVDETSRVDGSRQGGVLSYWMAEAATKTASKPKFRQMEIIAHKEAALVYSSDELLQDATALEGYLNQAVADELRFQAEAAIFRGDGVGKPLGWINSPSLVTITRDTGSKILAADVIGMWTRLWPSCHANAVWYISPEASAQLYQMYLTSSLAFPFYTIDQAGVTRMFGRPVIVTEYASALNTTGDIMLVDPTQYFAVRKGGVEAASSIHVQFVTDETAYRFVWRVGGQSSWSSPVTPYKGSSTLSDIVVLSSAT